VGTEKSKCPDCNGTGLSVLLSVHKRCPTCEGYGVLNPEDREDEVFEIEKCPCCGRDWPMKGKP